MCINYPALKIYKTAEFYQTVDGINGINVIKRMVILYGYGTLV